VKRHASILTSEINASIRYTDVKWGYFLQGGGIYLNATAVAGTRHQNNNGM